MNPLQAFCDIARVLPIWQTVTYRRALASYPEDDRVVALREYLDAQIVAFFHIPADRIFRGMVGSSRYLYRQ